MTGFDVVLTRDQLHYLVVGVIRETISGAGEGAARRAAGIAVGEGLASEKIQKPAGWAVEAATGEKL